MEKVIAIFILFFVVTSCSLFKSASIEDKEDYYDNIKNIDTSKIDYYNNVYHSYELSCNQLLKRYEIDKTIDGRPYIFFTIDDLSLFIINKIDCYTFVVVDTTSILRISNDYGKTHFFGNLFQSSTARHLLSKEKFYIEKRITNCIKDMFLLNGNNVLNYSYTYLSKPNSYILEPRTNCLLLFNNNGNRILSLTITSEKPTLLYYDKVFNKKIFNSNGLLVYLGLLLLMEFEQ